MVSSPFPSRLSAGVTLIAASAFGLVATISRAEQPAPPPDSALAFDGGKSTWHDGFVRYDFVMDDETLAIAPFTRPEKEGFAVGAPAKGQRRCIVVVPNKPAPGNPWSWQGCYWDHQPQAEVELLRRGFYIAFITPDPGKQWDAWYAWLTEQHGLSKKPAFDGMSKGGVNAYQWATANPDKVSCIYADNPAIYPESILKLGELARHDVPLLNVCGSLDFVLEKNTKVIENAYHQSGGRISIMIKEGTAHHPHSLQDPKPIADFIEQSVQPATAARPDFVDETFTKSYYYSDENSYLYLPKEDTYATCRGPQFTNCYDRYDKEGKSWGITGMAVLVPKMAAAGKPWVFRADRIGRDASAVDLALLAKGFYIVAPPLLAQTGPLREDWDAVYKTMTDHGFSKRPAMEGAGAGAGEAYAWAIENPEKISCLYGENPVLRSTMLGKQPPLDNSKKPPLDNLAPLAKARVPILHVCGSLDPWLDRETRVAEKRYQALGGEIKVIVKPGEGHFPLGPQDPSAVVDFIVANAGRSDN
jgi:pimeloyl-ACP methyl ester carboxylesterase